MSDIKAVSKLRFAPYRYSLELESGEIIEWHLISIKYKDLVIRLTDWHQYVGPKQSIKKVYENDIDAIRRICNFLTYAIYTKRHEYNATCPAEIPFEAVVDYLNTYIRTKNMFNRYPDQQSVEKERNAICHFMRNLGELRNDYNEHYYARVVKEVRKGTKGVEKNSKCVVWEYEITAKYIQSDKDIFIRDIPQKAIPIILRHIRMRAPELLLGVLLEICAGLRVGEVVNCRRANGKYPGGIKYRKDNGRFTHFEIDLNHEYKLRSDGIVTGKIKKERTQEVYPIFLNIIQIAYEQHLNLIDENEIEEEAPLFVNSHVNSKTGKRMAITKKAYCRRIKKIMYENVVPELMISNDVELRTFGMLLNENSWGTHAFRHFFTVQLVLNDEDLNGIAFWRGDSSLDSSYDYLRDKGELKKRYELVSNQYAQKITEALVGDIVNEIR